MDSIEITLVGHATLHIKTDKVSILSDPILFDPFCEGLNTIYPSRLIAVNEIPHYDVIFISHQHFDHFDIRSLAVLKKEARVLCPKDPLLVRALKSLGFDDIGTLGDMEMVSLGRWSILATPSLNRVPELGFVLTDGDQTFWNQVDTVCDLAMTEGVLDRVGNIDYLIAPWQPFQETSWQRRSDGRFPTDLYRSLLREIKSVEATHLSPGANGLEFSGNSRDLNHVTFPVLAERFAYDAKELSLGNVELLQPGDIATLSDHKLEIRRSAAPWISRIPIKNEGTRLAFAPCLLGSVFEGALDLPPVTLPAQFEYMPLLQEVALHSAAVIRDWQITYQLAILRDGAFSPLWLDCSGPMPAWRQGWNGVRNLTAFITADLLEQMASGQVSGALLATGGEYRCVDTVYRINRGQLESPKDVGQEVREPLLAWCYRSAQGLLERSVDHLLRIHHQKL